MQCCYKPGKILSNARWERRATHLESEAQCVNLSWCIQSFRFPVYMEMKRNDCVINIAIANGFLQEVVFKVLDVHGQTELLWGPCGRSHCLDGLSIGNKYERENK